MPFWFIMVSPNFVLLSFSFDSVTSDSEDDHDLGR